MTEDRYNLDNWPERYALGRLDDDARLEFEAHMLECERCFQEVQLSDRYVEGVRSLANDPLLQDIDMAPGRLFSGRLIRTLAAAAVILLAAALFVVLRGSGADAKLLAGLHQSGEWSYLALTPPGVTMRSGPLAADTPVIQVDRKGRAALFFDRPVAEGAIPAEAEILNRKGETLANGIPVLPVKDSSGLFGIVWPVGETPAGRYRLRVLDETGLEAGSAWFVLDK